MNKENAKKNLADKYFYLTCKGSHVAERRFEHVANPGNPHRCWTFEEKLLDVLDGVQLSFQEGRLSIYFFYHATDEEMVFLRPYSLCAKYKADRSWKTRECCLHIHSKRRTQ